MSPGARTWIGPAERERPPAGSRPAYWLRRELAARAAMAELRFSARGLVEVFVNGNRIGDELLPGYMQYRTRLPLRSYDVTPHLRDGTNAVAVLLGDGWYRGHVGAMRASDQWGEATSFWAELVVDGEVVAATDDGWRWAPSHVLAADLISGQVEDRRRFDHAITLPGYDDTGWLPVTVVDPPTATLVAYDAPPVRRVEGLRPTDVRQPKPGVFIADFGQNINGWCRLDELGPAGTETTLTHGEWLAADGDVDLSNLVVDLPFLPSPLDPGQVDCVISAGVDGDAFEPRLTTHGFRYVRITGHPGPITADDVTAIVVHSDLRRIGSFTCDDERVNRLHAAAVWSLRGNVCEIPTDCPQRERSGWTGDWQVFTSAAAFLYDVEDFSRKWLADVRADQRADGAVANISPSAPAEGFDSPLGALNGSAGWGDVVVLTPWELYQAYGDAAVLAEGWDAMVRWVSFGEAAARGRRSEARSRAHPMPLPHETFLWDTGFHWGEWLEPDVDLTDFPAFVRADKSEVATAYLHRSAATMHAIAAIIGQPADVVAHYKRLADGTRDAWQREFVTDDGTLRVQTQASHVRALAFGLAPDEHRSQIADRLAQLVRDASTTVGTGFLSTGLLLPTLADHGHLDLAYELLLQPNRPGWMHMIDRGATTMWERWEGVDDAGRPHESLNHYSKGAVIGFLHRYVAGLGPTSPGYATFDVAPRPGGGVHHAAASLESPHGVVTVEWSCDRDGFTMTAGVPKGATARLRLPDGTIDLVGAGVHTRRSLGGE